MIEIVHIPVLRLLHISVPSVFLSFQIVLAGQNLNFFI